MTTVKRLVIVTVFLFITYLLIYRFSAQPLLGVAIEQNGRELFVPRHRVICDKAVIACTLRLNQGYAIDLTSNRSTLPGNCSGFAEGAKGPLYTERYQCTSYTRGYWRNEATQRHVVVLTGVELSLLQTARMQAESWIIAIVTGSGTPFKLFLASLSSLLGLQVAQTLFMLQRDWGTHKQLAYVSASTAGLLVALFGWIPIFSVAEIWRFGPLY